jgi:hypothetical protein
MAGLTSLTSEINKAYLVHSLAFYAKRIGLPPCEQ